ncbi:MAG: stalk domain-containing protein, partial [Victivallaceae bacterium]
NRLDLTRDLGAALTSAARVYAGCYNRMTPQERDFIRTNMERLIIDMECGWPPFLQSIVNGHGNEAQINRDLLSMAIAIYDEDPVPYQYCSYAILEQLVPMRKFEYQSPRHNQGVGYGSYRFGWDMHSAWLFRRMLGKEVFDPNIKNVKKYWQYMRLPDGEMLRDGDGIPAGKYWGAPLTMLLCYSYSDDPVLKGEFERQGGLAYDPVLYLTLNNPDLKAEKSLKSLPLTIDFGPVLSGMIMRTGWNIGRGSSDVVAEIKGGGTHFGNHQHSDAGSFQIYYRGLQAAKLGQYKFYGTPYDMNFAKRSISQPMMLVVDPAEDFRYSQTNDGGVRFVQYHPKSAKDATENPEFNNGKKISGSFGPSPMRPLYSYFSVSLKGAYSAKVTDYVRSFCFLNLGDEKVPAAVIILDDLTAAKAEFKKYWQINGLCQPELTPDGVILSNNRLGAKGKLVLSMVKPAPADRKVEVLTGDDANSVFGKKFTPPYDSPEAHGSRVMFSPVKASANDVFLSVIQLVDGDSKPLPYEAKETDYGFTVAIADRFVALVKGSKLLNRAFTVSVPAGAKVLAAGLAPGQWFVAGPGAGFNATVEAEKNTVFFVSDKGGSYTLTPGGKTGAPAQKLDTTLEPHEVGGLAENAVAVYDKILPGLTTRKGKGFFMVPAVAVFKALGAEVKDADGMLTVTLDGRKAVFLNHSADFTLEGQRFVMNGTAVRQDGVWWIPDQVIAGLAGSALVRDEVSNSVAFTKLAVKRNPLLLWAEVSSGEGLEELIACLGEPGSSGKYFAFFGTDVYFRLALAKPVKLRGVGIHFLSGAARKYKFKLEAAGPDGKFETVFNGESVGGKEGFEDFTFAPREVSQLKYTGYGNSENNWNSIVNIKLLE